MTAVPIRANHARIAAKPEAIRKLSEFHIPDIHCDACIRALTGAVWHLDDQATLKADLTTKQVRIETTATERAVAEALRDAGFTVEPV